MFYIDVHFVAEFEFDPQEEEKNATDSFDFSPFDKSKFWSALRNTQIRIQSWYPDSEKKDKKWHEIFQKNHHTTLESGSPILFYR